MMTRSVPARCCLALAVVVVTGSLLTHSSASQQSQPPQSAFRSGIELLRLPVSVVDEQGRPVRDLAASEFVVKVDGKERKLRFANFFGSSGDGRPSAGAGAAVPSFTLNTAAAAGRVVVFAVDLISIKQGYERPILDTAAALADGLGANDAVGLMPIVGKSVDVTRNRAQVSEALRLLRGTTNVPFITHYFTVREAVAFEQLDRRVIAETIERECCASCTTCPSELRDETREFLRFARYHVQSVLRSLTGLAASLERIAAPKTIVLLSAGLPFEQESLTLFLELQRALTRAGVMIYAVQVSQPDNDASNLRRPGVGTYQASDITTGLANVATMAGGAMFMGVGTASGIFERLKAEIVQGYELGVESVSTDHNGKGHDVEVKVSRRGVVVRSRPKVLLPDEAADASNGLANLLSQPVDVADLPVALTAYTVRGDEPATVKVIIAAELGHGITVSSPIRYAFAATQGGKVAFAHDGTADQSKAGERLVTGAQLAPGQYRLRAAAIDGAGRRGSVELPIAVGLKAAGDLQFSDLIVGVTGEAFAPAIRAPAGQALEALVELYAVNPAGFANAAVTFEVRRANEPALLSESRAQLRSTTLERRQVADGRVTAGLLPGDYRITAVIAVDNKPVGRVSRAILIDP